MKNAYQTIHKILVILFGLLLTLQSGFSQSIEEVIPITKINTKIHIDGKVDEAIWESVTPLPLTMHWPAYQGKSTEATEIRVAYDAEYLYVGAICHESDVSGIQTTTFQRDQISPRMDAVAIILDPYNDNENSLFFSVSPTGSRADAAVKNDAQGDNLFNTSWNGYWIANSTINEGGWQTEIRIPFSSLRFQEQNGQVEMGMIAYRYIARKREMNIFPAVRPDWGFWSFAKASQAQTVSFEGIQNKRPIYTSPYALLGTGHHHENNDQGDFSKMRDRNVQLGLDVQHAVSDNLNVDLTVNTDFAQVEADNETVNLSRFSLFFPEKRRFFLERSSTFDFNFDRSNNLFYSRRIGIKDGELVPLYGGGRLVGRVNKWDVGLLNMQSRAKGGFLSENFGVFRLRRNVFNPRSYVGAMLTSRVDGAGNRNFAYGVDGIINVFKQDYLKINIAQTMDTHDTTGTSGLDRARIYLMWENRIQNGFGYRLSYSNVGEKFNPGLGFERRFNFTQLGDNIFYNKFAREGSSLRQTTITLNTSVSFNNSTNKKETHTLGLSSRWEWDRGSSLSIGLEDFSDNVPAAFNLSDKIAIQPGKYSNVTGTLNYGTPSGDLFRGNVSVQAGTFYGGERISATISPEVVFSKYFQASGFYQYNAINFKELNQQFTSHLFRLNMSASINVKLSVSAFAQVNTLNNISSLNLRIRYNPRDGNDFFLVFNEALNNNFKNVGNHMPFSDTRAIMVKYIHTFRI
jgi:hypothetical protein